MLTDAQNDYLDTLEDFYDQTGTYPNTIRANLINNEFEAALKFRGLPPPDPAKLDKITPVQRAVIRSLTDLTDKRPIKIKLQNLGVTTQEYNKWRRNPRFQEFLNNYVSKTFQDISQDAKLAISHLVISGDLNAIKYYHELTGQSPSQNQDQTTLNLSVVLAKLMEILIRYLPPETLQEVADEVERAVFPSPRRTIEAHVQTLTDAEIEDNVAEVLSKPLPKKQKQALETLSPILNF